MNAASRKVRNVYLVLNLCIWLPTFLIAARRENVREDLIPEKAAK